MGMYNEVELYKEPLAIKKILSENKVEMSEQQSAMLCGLIREYKPQKIVEVGVAGGGTTAIILNCISILEIDTEVYSVDISECYYRKREKKTGYLGEECKMILKNQVNHKFFLGRYLPECIDEIGKDIDFLILDTMHILPGELLDFIAAFPYLKEGAVVVLHDIFLNYHNNSFYSYATRVLLSSVAGEKIIGRGNDNGYNIVELGAFKITQDTNKYIENVFSALLVTWSYLPEIREIEIYKKCFSKHYGADLIEEFEMAVELNRNAVLQKQSAGKKALHGVYKFLNRIKSKEHIFIYGCGNFGIKLCNFLEEFGIAVEGYVVSDNQKKPNLDREIKFISEIEKEKATIILGVSTLKQREICEGMVISADWIPVDEEVLYFLKIVFG